MSIWISGDIHGSIDIKKLSYRRWPEGRMLTRDDQLIICGDFGMPWRGSNEEKYWLDWLGDRPWTTLFVDGNHECFPHLAELPVSDRWEAECGCTLTIRASSISCAARSTISMGRASSRWVGRRATTSSSARPVGTGFPRKCCVWWSCVRLKSGSRRSVGRLTTWSRTVAPRVCSTRRLRARRIPTGATSRML